MPVPWNFLKALFLYQSRENRRGTDVQCTMVVFLLKELFSKVQVVEYYPLLQVCPNFLQSIIYN